MKAPRRSKPIIRYADADVVVVDKPAGLTTMRHAHESAQFGQRARRYLPATLADLLPGMLEQPSQSASPKRQRKGKHPLKNPEKRGPPVRAVHRLDKETSGLVIFARTRAAESELGRQFRAHSTERRYLALVRGRAKSERIESYLVLDRGDGRRGSVAGSGEGQRAVTHVRVVEELGEFTLVECRLETGRTHQVRIHLGERGTPLCGERIYDRPLHGSPARDDSGEARPMLHAAQLGVDHPRTKKRMTWSAPLPHDMQALLKGMRRRRDEH
jgi:23S rRNA pseudouridine1911/1915/1917 synthase